MEFDQLVNHIHATHHRLSQQASKAVNSALTLRNWFMGRYIVEYELNGADRANYGEALIARLADKLNEKAIPACSERHLHICRKFYRTYPDILHTLYAESPSGDDVASVDTVLSALLSVPRAQSLLLRLTFSHFKLLVELDDPLKRRFYETEVVRGSWSVRELRRQINTLYFERLGLSRDPHTLSHYVQQGVEFNTPQLTIKDPYVFEFLGLPLQGILVENRLEESLLKKLRAFLLELGHGFCFEASQKRILIGDEYYFVDLVFYHRILKCHVLIELKVDQFRHEHLGQLNTYVNWYKKHQMTPGDNPPIGLLLCTQKDKTLMEYALAGLDNNLFVSRYQVEMPSHATIEAFLQEKLLEEEGISISQIAGDSDAV